MATPNGGWTFKIDREVCCGHGRCYSLAPDWFSPDDFGHGVPTGRAVQDTARTDMQFIVDSCPEEAISIVAVEAETVEAGKESK
jgi:ferredoxin